MKVKVTYYTDENLNPTERHGASFRMVGTVDIEPAAFNQMMLKRERVGRETAVVSTTAYICTSTATDDIVYSASKIEGYKCVKARISIPVPIGVLLRTLVMKCYMTEEVEKED